MIFLWCFYWVPVRFPWYFYDISMGFLVDSCVISMGFPWWFFGISLGFQRGVHEVSIGFLFFCFFRRWGLYTKEFWSAVELALGYTSIQILGTPTQP